MLKQVNLLNIPSVTSSLDSAAGATPCALPDGPRTDLFGRAVARANPSVQPVPGGGVTDERHLWPVWFNLIRECRPDVIFGEQVEAAINHGWLDLVQSDLEGEGYACGAVGLPAGGVGAPHIRQRLWFVADAQSVGRSIQHTPHNGSANAPSNTLANANDSVADQRRSDIGELAESDGCVRGAEQESKQPTRDERGEPARNCGAVDGQLGNTPSAGRRTGGSDGRSNETSDGRDTAQRGASGAEAKRTGVADGQLGNNNNKGSQGHGQSGEQHDAEGRQGAQRHNPTPSFWINCDWLPCRDGRSRPVEPGTFPLAYGISGRVGRLRAYGNAIVPQVAKTFIEAYLES